MTRAPIRTLALLAAVGAAFCGSLIFLPDDPAPAVSTWGLAVFALLILPTATVVIRRQRQAAG